MAVNNNLEPWSATNAMYINVNKTKEMQVGLLWHTNSHNQVPSIILTGRQIERVDTFKLLGVVISADLTWNAHINCILNKTAGKRVY